ncbi:MAG: hypothetical protein HY812_02775 [Planctomycetes bacterium]|nr:hypothetical protein [Planctomycetota bacterium]
MRVLSSLFTGLLLAPLFDLGVRLCQEASAGAAPGRVLAALALGGCALLVSLVPAGAASGRRGRALAGLILLAGVILALLAAGDARPGRPLVAAALFLLPALGLALLGGQAPHPAAFLLGSAAGLFVHAAWLMPSFGRAAPAVLAALFLAVARLAAPAARSEVTRRAWQVDLILCGLVLGFGFDLARPFVLQHTSGCGFSHAAVNVVLLLGAGLGAILAMPRRGAWISRALLPFVALLALLNLFFALRNASQPAVLNDLAFAASADTRLTELSLARALLGLAAIGAGLWLRDALSRLPACRGAGVLLLALGAGAFLAQRVLEGGLPWPRALLGEERALVRHHPALEILEEQLVTPDGVLRLARDNTLAQGEPHLWWQARRASRIEAFASLEAEEVSLAGSLLPAGGRLLLIGNASKRHRAAYTASPFSEYAVAPSIPVFPSASLAGEERLDAFRLGAGQDPIDAIVFLSSAAPAWRPARLLSREALAGARAALRPGGVLLVWFDLRVNSLDAIAAVSLALREVFGPVRTWIALDGHAGPFLALEAGPLPDVEQDGFCRPIPGEALTDGWSRLNSILDPVVETRRVLRPTRCPLADATELTRLAQACERRAAPHVAHLLRALAIHSANFFDVESATSDNERHRIVDEECDALVLALAAAPADPLVMNQVKRFIALAHAKGEYERLDRVLLPALAAHPGDAGLHYVSGKANFELQAFDLAIDDLELVVRSDRMQYEAFLLLGLSYASLEEPDFAAAISALEAARELRPDALKALRALGVTLCRAGREAEAEPYLERVIGEAPADEEARAYLERIRSR